MWRRTDHTISKLGSTKYLWQTSRNYILSIFFTPFACTATLGHWFIDETMNSDGLSDVGIIIYTELLSNIRQISVAIYLRTLPTAETKIEILENGHLIQVYHDGDARRLTLPSQTTIIGPVPDTLAKFKENHGTLRLPANIAQQRPGDRSDLDILPWNSPHLKAGNPIYCDKCSHKIVQDGLIHSWMDLPSENWAEMMEFWHCHKPHDSATGQDSNGEDALAKKGYGASNLISAKKSVGLVDLSTMMFAEQDCTGLVVSTPEDVLLFGLLIPWGTRRCQDSRLLEMSPMSFSPIQLS